MHKRGIILVNVGTPKSTDTKDVDAYLREFLMDPFVIDIPFIVRWPLVNILIVPKRAPESAEKYKKIWTTEGSPLLIHTKHLAEKLQAATGIPTKFAMLCSAPRLKETVHELEQSVSEILIVPLFPQFAQATIGSTFAQVKKLSTRAKISVLPPFYTDEGFIDSWATIFREKFQSKPQPDHVLFTFHGLPVRQIKKGGCARCLQENCCASIKEDNRDCYRAQCYATARLLADKLDLSEGTWSVSFQSRLGRAEWIRPYTEEILAKLAKAGKKNLAVLCPAFTADCLETIEEIGIGGEEIFHTHGGENFTLVPCLNSHERWVKALAKLVV